MENKKFFLNGNQNNQLDLWVKKLQIVFFLVVGGGTLFNSCMTSKYNKLIFKPVVGVVDVKTETLATKEDCQEEDVIGVQIEFIIENKGSLPAKNVKISNKGKIGNTYLAFTKDPSVDLCVVMIQGVKYSNQVKISKDVLARMTNEKERLIYHMELSYSDFEGYGNYSYSQFFEAKVSKRKPFTVSILPISGISSF